MACLVGAHASVWPAGRHGLKLTAPQEKLQAGLQSLGSGLFMAIQTRRSDMVLSVVDCQPPMTAMATLHAIGHTPCPGAMTEMEAVTRELRVPTRQQRCFGYAKRLPTVMEPLAAAPMETVESGPAAIMDLLPVLVPHLDPTARPPLPTHAPREARASGGNPI